MLLIFSAVRFCHNSHRKYTFVKAVPQPQTAQSTVDTRSCSSCHSVDTMTLERCLGDGLLHVARYTVIWATLVKTCYSVRAMDSPDNAVLECISLSNAWLCFERAVNTVLERYHYKAYLKECFPFSTNNLQLQRKVPLQASLHG